jgi:hypothetical protein
MDDDNEAIVNKLKEHASKSGDFKKTLEGKEHQLFKRIVLVTILLLHSKNPNSRICKDFKIYTEGFSLPKFAPKLYCYINYYQRVTIQTSSYYGLIFHTILDELKKSCHYNETTECQRIENENDIILIEQELWEKIGYVKDNTKKNDQNKKWLAVWNDFLKKMQSQKLDQENLRLQQQAFIEKFQEKFDKQGVDESFFEQLHVVLPEITKDNELEKFLSAPSFDFNKNMLIKYESLLRRSENYLQSFIREFREKHNLEPTYYVSLISQVKDLLNVYERLKIKKEKADADRKQQEEAAAEQKRVKEEAAAEQKRREEEAAAKQKREEKAALEKQKREEEAAAKQKREEEASLEKQKREEAEKEIAAIAARLKLIKDFQSKIKPSIDAAVKKGFFLEETAKNEAETFINNNNPNEESSKIFIDSHPETDLDNFLHKIPGVDSSKHVTAKELSDGIALTSTALDKFVGKKDATRDDFVNKIKTVNQSDKLADASTLQKITDEDFKNYWLEISKDNPKDNVIIELFKPDYYDIKNYVLAQFYEIADKSRRDQLNNTFDSFVFLCHMLEFMHGNPTKRRSYFDIYKNLTLDPKEKITEPVKNNVKSVFFKYLRLSLMGGLDQTEQNLINQMN